LIKGGRFGKAIAENEGGTKAQVQGQDLQPVPDLRPASRLYQEIRHLPNLFSKNGQRRFVAGRD
jgi:hypothetical protein